MTDTDMIRSPAPRPPYQSTTQPPQNNPIVRQNLNPTSPGIRPMLPQQQQQQQQQIQQQQLQQQQQPPQQQQLQQQQPQQPIQQQNMMSTNGQRSAPPPLRRIDSKGNMLINQSQQRPLSGPQMNQVNRPQLPQQISQQNLTAPIGMQQRPQVPQTNWSNQPLQQQTLQQQPLQQQPQQQQQQPPQQQRPQFQSNPNNNQQSPQQQLQPQNPQMRAQFPRVPGQHPVTAPNQPPFRPPFSSQQQLQQQQQMQLQQQQQQQQQQLQQQQIRQMPIQKTGSSDLIKPAIQSNNSYQNNNDNDDDDVVIGQTLTTQKNFNKPSGINLMTQSQYGSIDKNKLDPYSTKLLTNQRIDTDAYKNVDNLTTFSEEYNKTKPLNDNIIGVGGVGGGGGGIGNVNLEQLNIFATNNKPSVGQTNQMGRKMFDDSQDFNYPVGKPQQQQQQHLQLQQQQQQPPHTNLNQKMPPMKQPSMDASQYSAIQQKTYTDLKQNRKGDNDSGVDEFTQGNERNGPGSPGSPLKTPTQPQLGLSRPPSATPSNKSRSASRSRLLLKTPEPEPVKKVPMNKIKVGNAPSPDLKAVRSKIGSLDNSAYKPGGGNVKIEHNKIQIKAAPRIEAKNDKYVSKGGDKKILSTKLQWNAKSKIGSLENANHKPGGGDKKIETLKPDFKDKAKPKVGSKDNVKYTPGGGDIKHKTKDSSATDIQTQKIDIKAQSKIGSMDNVKHRPGGGDKKIFDDKDYLKNVEHPVALSQPSQYWQAPKITRSTTIHSEMSLPAECLVLSVSMPSLNSTKRPKSAGPPQSRRTKEGHAVHPRPFRCY